MDHAEVIAKVRKLYALANGNTSEGETAAAIAAAERLIQAHRLSEAEIFNQTATTIEDACLNAERPVWIRMLFSSLCKLYQCAPIQDSAYWRVFGRPEDLALLRLQFDRIREQVARLSVLNCTGKGRSYADSYKKGVAAVVCLRLSRAAKEAQQASSSTAIVRIDQRKEEAQEALRAAYPRAIEKRSAPLTGNPAAFQQGMQDGRHVHMGESLASGVKGELSDGS